MIIFKPFIWWYTEGVIRLRDYIFNEIRFTAKRIGFFILLKNIYKPLYGLHTKWDVLISIIVRIGHFIFISIIMTGYTILLLLLLVTYLGFPLFTIYNIFIQIF